MIGERSFVLCLMVGFVWLGFGMMQPTLANGYKILCVRDAKATAMGEAFVAQADNPSAVAFNPAGLAQLSGNQVNAQVTFVNGYTERRSLSGEEVSNIDRWQMVPAIYATTQMDGRDMAAGIGVTFPNGLSSEWSEDSFARYVATYSDLMVADISPAIGVHIGEKWMLGAGVNLYYSAARLERMLDLGLLAGAPGSMDVNGRLKGTGMALGGTIGAIYIINSQNTVGLTYRLPYTIDYDGTYEVDEAGIYSDVDARIDFPAVIVAGYAYRPTDQWTVEVDLDWTDWSQTRDIAMDFESPDLGDAVQEQDLENALACKVGAEYRYSDKVALRAGYIFNQNATPEATWRPSLPDTDMHFITGGVGFRADGLTIDVALQLVYYTERHIDNNVDNNEMLSSSTIDGEYRTWAPCISFSGTYYF